MTRSQVAFVFVGRGLSPRHHHRPFNNSKHYDRASRIVRMDIRIEIMLLFTTTILLHLWILRDFDRFTLYKN